MKSRFFPISLELTGELEQEEQNLMVKLSQAYLEWEQQTEQRGLQQGLQQGLQREKVLILRQLTRRVGDLPEAVRLQVESLSLSHLEALGEALLDFQQLTDLLTWLEIAARE
jgi:predicted transposase YdaD